MEEISYSGGKKSIRKKVSKRILLFISLFLAILVLIGGVVFFVTRSGDGQVLDSEDINKSKTEKLEQKTIPSTVVTMSSVPTPSPSTEVNTKLDKSTLRIAIQNGSGEVGVAGKLAGILRTAGYSVISTGNADNFNYSDITIKVKSIKKGFIDLLENDLKKDYSVGETSSDLAPDLNYDALIIIGK